MVIEIRGGNMTGDPEDASKLFALICFLYMVIWWFWVGFWVFIY